MYHLWTTGKEIKTTTHTYYKPKPHTMKPIIDIIEFSFILGESRLRVKWQLLGTKLIGGINFKSWRVTVINNYDGSGVANKVIGDAYHTTLPPCVGNSTDFLRVALKR